MPFFRWAVHLWHPCPWNPFTCDPCLEKQSVVMAETDIHDNLRVFLTTSLNPMDSSVSVTVGRLFVLNDWFGKYGYSQTAQQLWAKGWAASNGVQICRTTIQLPRPHLLLFIKSNSKTSKMLLPETSESLTANRNRLDHLYRTISRPTECFGFCSEPKLEANKW